VVIAPRCSKTQEGWDTYREVEGAPLRSPGSSTIAGIVGAYIPAGRSPWPHSPGRLSPEAVAIIAEDRLAAAGIDPASY
jgi:hypothetical protein